ncbi:MAG TPA: murein biosynthesis integral membrane protein MurJ, partial [Gaiellaceae bacterium]|nr:murein biosynthesis integral membrane protein MurJ [Gaiellaceae bacterium]
LSGAFVPVFSDLLERGEKARAWRVASTLFWLVLLVLSGVTALFVLLAPFLLAPFGEPGGDAELTVGLARVLFPIVVLLGLSGIVVGVLNTYHHFALPALAPVAWNLVIVLGLALGVPRVDGGSAELYLYAGVVVLGTLVQLLLPVPWLRRLDGRLTLALDWRDPAVRRVLMLMVPVTLTIGLVNVNFVVDTFFASRLLDPELAPTAIDKAFRLYMLPQGVFGVAVTTVLFPTLARLSARADAGGLRRALDGGLRQIAFLLVPAGLLSIVLADPIVRLVYERGEFTAADTTVVADCLQAFSLGLVFNGWLLVLNRSFYAIQSNWIPTGVALGAVVLNGAADAVLYRLGVWGIPLATALVNVVASGVLLVLMRRRIGLEHVGRTLVVAARIVLAAGAAAAAAYALWWGLDEALGRSLGAQVLSLAGAFALGATAYAAGARALRVRELEALLLLRRGA